jgi:hypothetical protein
MIDDSPQPNFTIMSLLLILHIGVTWALVGLIWLVQVVQYPMFARVGRVEFVAFHAEYCRRISWVVGPMMLCELGSAVGLLWLGLREGWFLAGLPLVILVWGSTALVQVPLHERLRMGFDEHVARRLVVTNWVRTVAWSLRGALLAWGIPG